MDQLLAGGQLTGGVPRQPPFTILDLFAGCGGFTRGFTDQGEFVSVGAVEMDRAAASTYAANFDPSGSHTVADDIAGYTPPREVDVVVGGPPCQGFSMLGKRDPHDPRNALWRQFLRVTREAKASMFVLENVDRFAATPEFDLLCAAAADGGPNGSYETQAFRLNAADFGVPQRRVRTIVVGSRVGQVRAPRPTHAKVPHGGTQAWRTLRDVFLNSSHPLPPGVKRLHLPGRRSTVLGHDLDGSYSLADLHVTRPYDLTSLIRYAHVAPGQGRFALPDELQYPCWRKHARGQGDVLGRLQWDEPATTIRTEFFRPEKGRFLHPQWHNGGEQVNRALTHAEAAVVQGFDERHVWHGSRTEIARQIGNAVPPGLAEAVAKSVSTLLRARSTPPDSGD